MDTSSDEADDWFIESLNTYKDLHVFQLEHPTKVIEWTGDKSICVAGYTEARSEILELLLPLKLYAGDNQGLCAERDFKVQHGGFSEEPVECLIHIPETRFVVTSGGSSPALQIWDIGGDDSDVIKRTGVINPKSPSAKCGKIASGLTENPTALHGSYTNDVQLTELATGRVLYTVGNESSDLESMSGLHWCFGLRSSSSDPSLCTIARLSSSGQMVLSDLRDLQNSFCQTQLNVQHISAKNEFLNVSWASVLDSCLSVSGFDGTVQVYNTRNWSTEAQTPQPVFSHRGHDMSYEAKCSGSRPVVTTHAWHPSRPNTLLSAATDGSVHVWDWVDKSTYT
ncbi:WD repeat-containing protein 73 isoform X2 [Triplophysa dalaica]|uniref:WD repeat-containing protein 73 isoform X2 n=1 Tax=Triplophysa dalaica TaxID=1582913 RepID=UPI0024E00065|nr:WD repeat-containing protein 73 isoform X2 [Triplophysa dalaica]